MRRGKNLPQIPGYLEDVAGTEQTNVIEDQIEDPKPLVCYQIERDQLRQLLIDWLKGRVEAAGWFTAGVYLMSSKRLRSEIWPESTRKLQQQCMCTRKEPEKWQ